MRYLKKTPFSFGYGNVPKENWERTFGKKKTKKKEDKPKQAESVLNFPAL